MALALFFAIMGTNEQFIMISLFRKNAAKQIEDWTEQEVAAYFSDTLGTEIGNVFLSEEMFQKKTKFISNFTKNYIAKSM